jgi:hypothetical protein
MGGTTTLLSISIQHININGPTCRMHSILLHVGIRILSGPIRVRCRAIHYYIYLYMAHVDTYRTGM